MLRSKHGPKSLSSFFPCGVETSWDFQKILQSSEYKVKGKIKAARNMKAPKLIHNSSHLPQEELVGQQRMKGLTAHSRGTARPSHSFRVGQQPLSVPEFTFPWRLSGLVSQTSETSHQASPGCCTVVRKHRMRASWPWVWCPYWLG